MRTDCIVQSLQMNLHAFSFVTATNVSNLHVKVALRWWSDAETGGGSQLQRSWVCTTLVIKRFENAGWLRAVVQCIVGKSRCDRANIDRMTGASVALPKARKCHIFHIWHHYLTFKNKSPTMNHCHPLNYFTPHKHMWSLIHDVFMR